MGPPNTDPNPKDVSRGHTMGAGKGVGKTIYFMTRTCPLCKEEHKVNSQRDKRCQRKMKAAKEAKERSSQISSNPLKQFQTAAQREVHERTKNI